MSLRLAAVLLVALAGVGVAHAGDPPAPAVAKDAASRAAIEGIEAWWQAFSRNDAAYLRAHSAPDLGLVLANGSTFDLAGMLAMSATFGDGKGVEMTWSDHAVRRPGPDVAIVQSHLDERVGPNRNAYRVLTVLERRAGTWQVSSAQSTRELIPSPRIPLADAGAVEDFVGHYLTPKRLRLSVERTESGLVLVAPDGKRYPIEPVGPALFELADPPQGQGVVRIAFARNADGKVTSLTRIVSSGLAVFPRE